MKKIFLICTALLIISYIGLRVIGFSPVLLVLRAPNEVVEYSKCLSKPNSRVVHLGFSQFAKCIRQFEDRGKACRSSSECLSNKCIPDWDHYHGDAQPGDIVPGVCSGDDLDLCWLGGALIENGKSTGNRLVCD